MARQIRWGDIFLAPHTPPKDIKEIPFYMLGVGIIFISSLWGEGDARYRHAGIVLDNSGRTLESNLRIEQGHMRNYKGKTLRILRHRGMTAERSIAGWRGVEHLEGMHYPFWRLLMHLAKPTAMTSLTGIPVCSELALMFWTHAGVYDGRVWGQTPWDINVLFRDNHDIRVRDIML